MKNIKSKANTNRKSSKQTTKKANAARQARVAKSMSQIGSIQDDNRTSTLASDATGGIE